MKYYEDILSGNPEAKYFYNYHSASVAQWEIQPRSFFEENKDAYDEEDWRPAKTLKEAKSEIRAALSCDIREIRDSLRDLKEYRARR